MFEEIFGARGFSQQRQRGPRKGQDLQVTTAAHYIREHTSEHCSSICMIDA
jgi:hypothetical protein